MLNLIYVLANNIPVYNKRKKDLTSRGVKKDSFKFKLGVNSFR